MEGTSSELDPDTSCAGESTSLRRGEPGWLKVFTTVTKELNTERDPQKFPQTQV